MQNDSDPFGRQCNLDWSEKIKFNANVVHCGNDIVVLDDWVSGAAFQAQIAAPACPAGLVRAANHDSMSHHKSF
jgi:hypothetical protein